VTVTPITTTTYTLTASNAQGSVTKSATVKVIPAAAVISDFSATPSTIREGDNTTLSWATEHATSLSIDQGVGDVTGKTSITLKPAATTTYTLTATGVTGPVVTRTLKVTVIPNTPGPSIQAFAANPATIDPGQGSTLSWTVSNATKLTIDNGVGVVTGTSIRVTPTATTTYTLKAENSQGAAVQATATVTVNPLPKPTINGFIAVPTTIRPGDSAQLRWDVRNATVISIDNGVGTVTGTSTSVTPSITTTYTLTAENPQGRMTATATVTVVPNLPAIRSFSSVPASVPQGRSTSLVWDVVDATRLTIDHGVGVVTGTSVTVSPDVTTTYTLKAENGAGQVIATATVTVIPKPVIRSFTATPSSINEGGSTLLSWSVDNALRLTLDQGVGDVTGKTSITVSPTTTTTYTLMAENAAVVTATVTVTVVPLTMPVISDFSTTGLIIDPGTRISLAWAASNQDRFTLQTPSGPVELDSTTFRIDVRPEATFTYVLTAWRGTSSVSKSVTVTVVTAPPIFNSGVATPSTVNEGDPVQLTLNLSGATLVQLRSDQGDSVDRNYLSLIDATTPSGNEIVNFLRRPRVTPNGEANYYLTVSNSFGQVIGALTVPVTPAPLAPMIRSFVATPATVKANQPFTFSWDVQYAYDVFINGVKVTRPDSVVNVHISAITKTTVFTLTASNSRGEALLPAMLTVTVEP
jgi:hypothetical protein